jgi:hypothetical protein
MVDRLSFQTTNKQQPTINDSEVGFFSEETEAIFLLKEQARSIKSKKEVFNLMKRQYDQPNHDT